MHQYPCLAAAALARRGAHSARAAGRATRAPASPSCAWQAGLDTGPMLAARSIEIGARDTAKTLHDELAILGAELIVETLDALAAGRSHEIAQPAAGVTYAQKISKSEASDPLER